MTYSLDFRKKVLLIRAQEGLSFEEAGRRLGIGKQTIYRWSQCVEAKLKWNKNPVSKFVYVELLEKCGKGEAAQFLRNLLKAYS